MLRYLFKLQSRDLALNTSMISLGSCTMKVGAALSRVDAARQP
jgi:glycine dehydrogenase